jgi:hypothetical protein
MILGYLVERDSPLWPGGTGAGLTPLYLIGETAALS